VFLLFFQQGAPAPGPTIASAPLPPSIQKTPDRKSVGSPGVQGSPRKVSSFGFFQQKILNLSSNFLLIFEYV
jgi:hypothetical protein